MFETLEITLGDFFIGEAPVGDIVWFLAGVLVLTSLTAVVIRWNAQGHPDPFEKSGDDTVFEQSMFNQTKNDSTES